MKSLYPTLIACFVAFASLAQQASKPESAVFTYNLVTFNPMENGSDIEMTSEKGERIMFYSRQQDKTNVENILFKKPMPEAMDTLTKPELVGKKFDILFVPGGKLQNGWRYGKIVDLIAVDSTYSQYSEAYKAFSELQTTSEQKNKTTSPISVLDEMLKMMKTDIAGCKKFISPSNDKAIQEFDKYASMKKENQAKYQDKQNKIASDVDKHLSNNVKKTILFLDENTCYISWGKSWKGGAIAKMEKSNGKWYVADPFDGRWQKDFSETSKLSSLSSKQREQVFQRFLKQKYQLFELKL